MVGGPRGLTLAHSKKWLPNDVTTLFFFYIFLVAVYVDDVS